MDVDLRLVPRREDGMTPEEVLLSESQERMLLVVGAGREDEVLRVARRWELPAVVIGRVVAEAMLTVRDGDRTIVSLDPRYLTEAPAYRPDGRPPAYLNEARRLDLASLPAHDPAHALLALLRTPGTRSARWVFRQYDHMIQTNTVVPPGADAAVLRLKDAPPRGLALAVDGNGRSCYLDPCVGGMLAVLEAAQNLACAGAAPAAATDCLNFASPERPDVFWTFTQAVDGIARACEALGVPVVGGNVSFYNEAGGGIYPTPIVAMLGRMDDVRRHAVMGWGAEGDAIVLFGDAVPVLDGSEYLDVIHHRIAGRLPEPDLPAVARTIRCVGGAVAGGLVASAHDCAEGGIAVALAESCLASGMGARVALSGAGRPDATLFGEAMGRVLASVREDRVAELLDFARRLGVPVQVIGTVGGDRLLVQAGEVPSAASSAGRRWLDVPVKTLAQAWGADGEVS
jgi:phosphoribosylformylglycinamidine synthase